MTTNIKVYGLMRSWTNLAAYLLDANFEDVRAWHHHPGWRDNGDPGDKHGPPSELEGMSGYLLCVKAPEAWLVSMLRYRPAPAESLVELWNVRHAEYVAFVEEARSPVVLMRYEEVLTDTEAALERIRTGLHLTRRPAVVGFPDQAMWRGGDRLRHAVTDQRFDANYYTEGRFLNLLTPEHRAVIDATLDRQVAMGVGYGR